MFFLLVLLIPISFVLFIIGLILSFQKSEKEKKEGIQMMLYSSIVFVIGTSVCFLA